MDDWTKPGQVCQSDLWTRSELISGLTIADLDQDLPAAIHRCLLSRLLR